MSATKLVLTAEDKHSITVYHWRSPNPKAVILLLHGMAEHAERYSEFAEVMGQSGYSVIAPNHRGHGSNTPQSELGHFADSSGWQKILTDVSTVHDFALSEYPDRPVYIMGHSMGSFITQAWLMSQPRRVAGVILSGSNFAPRMLLLFGRAVAVIERFRLGTNSHSKLIDTLSFGSYNSAFKPVRTTFDWLSGNLDAVDRYIADPFCGFLCTNRFWLDLFEGLLSITSVKALRAIDSQLPFYIFGGSQDPVGQQGKGLRKLADALNKAGISEITLDIWPEGRHEMLNETNRMDVISKLQHWLDEQVEISTRTNL